MTQQRQESGPSGFFAAVAGTMPSLNLRERWDDYRHAQVNREEGRIALTSLLQPSDRDGDGGPLETGVSEDVHSTSFLDTSLPTRATRLRRKAASGVCCGMNVSLFWRAFGIVAGLLVLWNAVKLTIWAAVTPPPDGLEDMPAYSTSLGCLDAPHIYNGSMVTFETGMAGEHPSALVITGGAVGTITIHKAPSEPRRIRYTMTLRTDDESLLEQVQIHEIDEGESSRLLLNTPEAALESTACSRFDINIYIPSTSARYHLAAHTRTHVRFDGDELFMNHLYISMYDVTGRTQILPHANVHADELKLEMSSGWLVGDVSVSNLTMINTHRGDARTNLQVKPTLYRSNGPEIPPAKLITATGRGRTDITYTSDPSFKHRTIHSDHSSSTGDIYLTYKHSGFNGLVQLNTKSLRATGIQKLADGEEHWTHYVGDKEGGDSMRISSRGWTGLYF